MYACIQKAILKPSLIPWDYSDISTVAKKEIAGTNLYIEVFRFFWDLVREDKRNRLTTDFLLFYFLMKHGTDHTKYAGTTYLAPSYMKV